MQFHPLLINLLDYLILHHTQPDRLKQIILGQSFYVFCIYIKSVQLHHDHFSQLLCCQIVSTLISSHRLNLSCQNILFLQLMYIVYLTNLFPIRPMHKYRDILCHLIYLFQTNLSILKILVSSLLFTANTIITGTGFYRASGS